MPSFRIEKVSTGAQETIGKTTVGRTIRQTTAPKLSLINKIKEFFYNAFSSLKFNRKTKYVSAGQFERSSNFLRSELAKTNIKNNLLKKENSLLKKAYEYIKRDINRNYRATLAVSENLTDFQQESRSRLDKLEQHPPGGGGSGGVSSGKPNDPVWTQGTNRATDEISTRQGSFDTQSTMNSESNSLDKDGHVMRRMFKENKEVVSPLDDDGHVMRGMFKENKEVVSPLDNDGHVMRRMFKENKEVVSPTGGESSVEEQLELNAADPGEQVLMVADQRLALRRDRVIGRAVAVGFVEQPALMAGEAQRALMAGPQPLALMGGEEQLALMAGEAQRALMAGPQPLALMSGEEQLALMAEFQAIISGRQPLAEGAAQRARQAAAPAISSESNPASGSSEQLIVASGPQPRRLTAEQLLGNPYELLAQSAKFNTMAKQLADEAAHGAREAAAPAMSTVNNHASVNSEQLALASTPQSRISMAEQLLGNPYELLAQSAKLNTMAKQLADETAKRAREAAAPAMSVVEKLTSEYKTVSAQGEKNVPAFPEFDGDLIERASMNLESNRSTTSGIPVFPGEEFTSFPGDGVTSAAQAEAKRSEGNRSTTSGIPVFPGEEFTSAAAPRPLVKSPTEKLAAVQEAAKKVISNSSSTLEERSAAQAEVMQAKRELKVSKKIANRRKRIAASSNIKKSNY
jgi:hypothetical protein